jgi:hypothetical protein
MKRRWFRASCCAARCRREPRAAGAVVRGGEPGEVSGGHAREDLGLPGRAHVPRGSGALPESPGGAPAAARTRCALGKACFVRYIPNVKRHREGAISPFWEEYRL